MKYKNKGVDIYSWVLSHQSGYHFLFKNKTKNLSYKGLYKFELKGTYIEDAIDKKKDNTF